MKEEEKITYAMYNLCVRICACERTHTHTYIQFYLFFRMPWLYSATDDIICQVDVEATRWKYVHVSTDKHNSITNRRRTKKNHV